MMYVRSSAVSPVWGYVRLPVSEKCMPMRCHHPFRGGVPCIAASNQCAIGQLFPTPLHHSFRGFCRIALSVCICMKQPAQHALFRCHVLQCDRAEQFLFSQHCKFIRLWEKTVPCLGSVLQKRVQFCFLLQRVEQHILRQFAVRSKCAECCKNLSEPTDAAAGVRFVVLS